MKKKMLLFWYAMASIKFICVWVFSSSSSSSSFIIDTLLAYLLSIFSLEFGLFALIQNPMIYRKVNIYTHASTYKHTYYKNNNFRHWTLLIANFFLFVFFFLHCVHFCYCLFHFHVCIFVIWILLILLSWWWCVMCVRVCV